jgi:hypothetical protein
MTKKPISNASLKSNQTLPEQRRRSRQSMLLHKVSMEATVNMFELDTMLQTFLSIIQKNFKFQNEPILKLKQN